MFLSAQEEIEYLNQELKEVHNLEGLDILLRKAAFEMGYGQYFLYGKRRGYNAYEFTPYPLNPKKTHYLYNDGISTGLCRYENLYRYLKFRK